MTDDGHTPESQRSETEDSHDDGSRDSGSVDSSRDPHGDDGLLGRLEVIESQPLAQRAARFEQLHDEMLAELQRGDQVT